MRVTCPSCGAEMTLDVLLAHEESRRAMATLLQLSTPLGALTVKYLALFRPAKRQLSFGRVAALLEELLPDLQRGMVTRGGRDWAAGIDTWKLAIETVLAARDKGTLTLPLKSHGYLYEVIAGHADKQEAQAERETEASRRGRANTGGAVQVAAVLAAAPQAAPAVAPAYTGPSPYARKKAAEIAAAVAARADSLKAGAATPQEQAP